MTPAEAEQRLIEQRIVAALTVMGYSAPEAGKTKLIDAMDMIATALEDIVAKKSAGELCEHTGYD